MPFQTASGGIQEQRFGQHVEPRIRCLQRICPRGFKEMSDDLIILTALVVPLSSRAMHLVTADEQ